MSEAGAGGAGHGSKKAIIAALLANLGIAVAKFVGFLLTRSSTLLAETAHSIADSTNQGLLLLGDRQAKRQEDEHHQFGYGMARYFWSFVVALVIFSLGALFALYEGIEKLRHPHHIDRPSVAIVLLGVAFVFEGISIRTAIRESRIQKGPQSWWSFIRTAKVPELPVVLLEDLGALLGLAIAEVSIVGALVTDNPRFDAYGTIAIAVLLGVIAIVLCVEMRSLLLGEAASHDDRRALDQAITGSPVVRRLIHVRTMHLGPEDVLVAAKVEFDASLSFADVAAAIDATEDRIRALLPTARVVYIEPAIFDERRSAEDVRASR